jgi:hypothetical protein
MRKTRSFFVVGLLLLLNHADLEGRQPETPKLLMDAALAVESHLGEGDQQEKVALYLRVFWELDRVFNPKLIFTDPPQFELAPPAANGHYYGSGIEPCAIQKPEIRKAYEQALKENEAKASRVREQVRLQSVETELTRRFVELVVPMLSSSEGPSTAVDELLKTGSLTATRRQVLKETILREISSRKSGESKESHPKSEQGSKP